MKKKILALCLVVVLAVTAVTGATLAYFTDTAADVNIMTVGNLDITQTEVVDKETPMVPMTNEAGMALNNKVVTITNDGNVPAYVRTIVAFEHTDFNNDGNYNDGIAWKIHAEYNEELTYTTFTNELDYLKIGDKVYSIAIIGNKELAKKGEDGSSVTTLHGVWFDASLTSAEAAVVGTDYDILVLSQGVQVEGFEGKADAAFEAAFGKVTPENVQKWFNESFSVDGE